MPGLVLEGGTMRPIFSAGAMDALLDYDVMFPYCVGVSAGSADGVSYISRQKGRNLEILMRYRNDRRYLGAGNLLKCKSLFGLEFVFEEIPANLIPFDMETYMAYEGRYLVGVTNARTGKSEYLDGQQLDEKNSLLKATCALPFYFPPIEIKGELYYDGGICDPIPVRKALADGNQKLLIILTRPVGYSKTLSRSNKLAARVLKRRYPNLVYPLLHRHDTYNETVRFCNELEAQGLAVVLRPEGDAVIDSFESNVENIKRSYARGYEQCAARMADIRALFNEEEEPE